MERGPPLLRSPKETEFGIFSPLLLFPISEQQTDASEARHYNASASQVDYIGWFFTKKSLDSSGSRIVSLSLFVGKNATPIAATPATQLKRLSQFFSEILYVNRRIPVTAKITVKKSRIPVW